MQIHIIKVYNRSIQIKSAFTSVLRYKTNFKGIPGNPAKTAVNLSYRIYGEPTIYHDKPTILLLHGLLGNKKHWDSVGKTIVNVMKNAVVSVDLRNHGDSPHVNSHRYEDLVGDILSLLDKMSIKRVSLVGHSIGGRAAMAISLTAIFEGDIYRPLEFFATIGCAEIASVRKHQVRVWMRSQLMVRPNSVAGLVVVDISPTTARHLTEFLPKILVAMMNVDFNKTKKLGEAKKEVREQLKTFVKDNHLLKAILSNVKMKSDHKIGWACNVDTLLKHFKYIASFPEHLRQKKFYGPTLFIGGQFSEYLPADDLSGIREMFSRAVVSYVPQVGHNMHVEDPKTFLEITIAFLRTNK